MQHVQRLTQEFAVDDKRDIGLGSTLSAGNDADTRASSRAKQLTSDTWCLFHVLTHDGDSS